MGSQTLEILRQGVWASFTGGWFYDPRQDHASNILHLYLWLLLLCLPFSLYMFFEPTLHVWTSYAVAVGVLFCTLKVINVRLHHMFDSGECIEESSDESNRSEDVEPDSHGTQERGSKKDAEHIEMSILNRHQEGETPPVQCSSRNSFAEGPSKIANIAPVESMELINRLMRSDFENKPCNSTIDLQVDVHHRNSSGSSGSASVKQEQPSQNEGVRSSSPMFGLVAEILQEVSDLKKTLLPSSSNEPGSSNPENPSSSQNAPQVAAEENLASGSSVSLHPDGRHHTFLPTSALCLSASSSSDALLKGTGSVELGFISQDPSVRAAELARSRNKAQQRSERDKRPVRRAHSELETCPEKPSPSVPPSHPVSLEVISRSSSSGSGIGARQSLPRRSVEFLRPTFGDVIKPIVELNDEHQSTSGDNGRNSIHEQQSAGSVHSLIHHRPSDPSCLRQRYHSASPDSDVHESTGLQGNVIDIVIPYTQQSARTPAPFLLSFSPNSSSLTQHNVSKCANDDHTPKGKKVSYSDPFSHSSASSCDSDKSSSHFTVIYKPLDPCQGNPQELDLPEQYPGWLETAKNFDRIPSPAFSDRSSLIGLDWLFNNESKGLPDPDGIINWGHLWAENKMSKLETSGHLTKKKIHFKKDEKNFLLPKDAEAEATHGSMEHLSDSTLSSPDETTPLDTASGSALGAIPKQNSDDKDFFRPLPSVSTRSSDRTRLRQRLLEILNKADPLECEQELLKLKKELALKRGKACKRPKLATTRRKSNQSGTSEFLSLLPPSTPPNPTDSERKTEGSSWMTAKSENKGPPAYLLASILSTPGTHLAISHDDTSTGAVHCFQDEHGNWQTYTFDENSSGIARGLEVSPDPKFFQMMMDNKWETCSRSSSSSGSTVIMDSGTKMPSPLLSSLEMSPSCFSEMLSSRSNQGPESGDSLRLVPPSVRAPFQLLPESFLNRASGVTSSQLPASSNLSHTASSQGGTDTELGSTCRIRFVGSVLQSTKPRHYYKFQVIPCKFIKVGFDRLALLAVLDRNLTFIENILSIMLAVMVAALGSYCLTKNFFQDIWSFVFCFVMASCQYSLLKSVQPDAASPTHGYNRVVLYSRPVYFCLCCLLLLLVQFILDSKLTYPPATMYGILIFTENSIVWVKSLLIVFILAFPLTFSLGLLPQVNTFIIYILEQIDMHIFGGTATTGLLSSFYCIFRSVSTTVILFGLAYVALKEDPDPSHHKQHIMFSLFCALLVTTCYHLSRCASDPTTLWLLIKRHIWSEEVPKKAEGDDSSERIDPLPQKLQDTVLARLRTDAIHCVFITILVFAVHVSTVFSALQPYLEKVIHLVAIFWGLGLHYVLPQMRKQLPWLCCSHPVFRSNEYLQFEVREPAKVMWFEKTQVWMWFIEKNVIYPMVILSALSINTVKITTDFGTIGGCIVLVVCGMKCLRSAFNDPSQHYLVLIFTILFFEYDCPEKSEPFLINYFSFLILFSKVYELLLKIRFIITYIAPWQITWGSAFHAFAQPFSVPHSAMLFLQAIVSAVLSTPLSPVLGSAIFFTSYVRPVKFWERDYNTKRVDHSNTRLSSQLERNPGSDDNNLNSIFYEHLTRSLQHSLYGDLVLGRWGNVSQGDCFVLASDNLNCLIHIIELGNGLVTFQLRGLEFRGTYCQQREVEAISEGVEDDEGCCCCEPGHLPHMLSVNAAFNQRWLAWEVAATKYVLEGYSISDNSAVSMLQVFDLRKALITYYVKAIVYYTITSSRLEEWLNMESIQEALKATLDKSYADLDPVFNMNIDEDYDFRASGISRNSFCNVYLEWVQYCIAQKGKNIDHDRNSTLVSLCFGLSLLARRALGTASNNSFSSVDFLLYGLHALFKGDFRITCARDEWVFQDMELLRKVVAPSVRMALKLHQDHFMSADEYDDHPTLFNAISNYEQNLVISHEADPAWRNAVLSSVPSLLALRHVFDDGSDEYKIIMLNKRYLSFRVIKVNRECVRGLWAGQQQELVYLRNRNPERGSIQNAKQALRNIINSSCDQPIGYPIYVSPLTTSYAETSEQLCAIIGGALSISVFKEAVFNFWNRLKIRCGEGCSSGGTAGQDDAMFDCSAPGSLSGSITRGSRFSHFLHITARRSHSSGSHSVSHSADTASDHASRSTGRASASSSIGRGSTVSSLGRNSATFTRTSLGNLAVSSVSYSKPAPSALLNMATFRPFGQDSSPVITSPFVISSVSEAGSNGGNSRTTTISGSTVDSGIGCADKVNI